MVRPLEIGVNCGGALGMQHSRGYAAGRQVSGAGTGSPSALAANDNLPDHYGENVETAAGFHRSTFNLAKAGW